MILDTNAISAIVENDVRVLRLLPATRFPSVPIVVVGEYRFGLRGYAQRERTELGFDVLLERSEILYLDADTAYQYADLRYALKLRGRPIPANDLWIAALALQHGLPVLSRDAHFDAVEGMTRVAW